MVSLCQITLPITIVCVCVCMRIEIKISQFYGAEIGRILIFILNRGAEEKIEGHFCGTFKVESFISSPFKIATIVCSIYTMWLQPNQPV